MKTDIIMLLSSQTKKGRREQQKRNKRRNIKMDKAKKRFLGIGVIAVIAVITFAFAIAASGSDGGVIEQNAEGVTVAASALTTSSISYQGRLTDSAGEPLSGTYDMTFRLYNDSIGGTELDTDTHSVEATDGLFNTDIDFDQSYFDGRELWFGITVGGEEMSPRQEFKPVPYALSLRPGAKIISSGYPALHAESTHPSGRGIRGYATADSGTNFGVVGASKSPDGYGGYFYNNGGGTGVYGEGKDGGYFTTNQGGTYGNPTTGVNVSTAYDYSPGVYVETTGNYSPGVYEDTYGKWSVGVLANTYGDNSNGVHAYTTGDNSNGIYARTTGNNSDGVYVYTHGDNSVGVHARASGTYGTGVYAKGGSSGYAAIFSGNVKITSRGSGATIMELGEGLDYAEGFDVSDLTKIEPGSVLIIDPDNLGKLTLSNTPYDTKVAGIVAGAKEMGSGVRLGTDQFDYDVALAGRVYCNVDATEEGVDPGDMLTTSAIPGYAMKSTDYMRAQGAILGKAMQRLEKGEKGQILVLVTLQ